MSSSEDNASKFHITKGDCCLLLVGIATSLLLLFLFCRASAPEGCTVTATVDGNTFGTWPVTAELTIEIPGVSGINILQITDGAALVTYADCPDLICVHHKPITNAGERIVCLPNKVVISISGPQNSPEDAVSQ